MSASSVKEFVRFEGGNLIIFEELQLGEVCCWYPCEMPTSINRRGLTALEEFIFNNYSFEVIVSARLLPSLYLAQMISDHDIIHSKEDHSEMTMRVIINLRGSDVRLKIMATELFIAGYGEEVLFALP